MKELSKSDKLLIEKMASLLTVCNKIVIVRIYKKEPAPQRDPNNP